MTPRPFRSAVLLTAVALAAGCAPIVSGSSVAPPAAPAAAPPAAAPPAAAPPAAAPADAGSVTADAQRDEQRRRRSPEPSRAPSPPPSPAASPSPSSLPSPVPSPAPSASPAGTSPVVGGCAVFPPDNPWNQDVSGLPVHPNSATYLASMNAATKFLHADFGSNPAYGIPYVIVPATQPLVPVRFTYADESDPGPYPIPPNAPIEGGAGATGDRHVLVLQSGTCSLYEMYDAVALGAGWTAGSGAVFHLGSNALRPDHWTSADAAGLPILPGLARYDETQTGTIAHALRFTVHATQNGFIHPATHFAGTANAALPPMGLRVRLKAGYDLTRFTGNARTILTALKKYGMIVADNGSDLFVSGATDARWNDTDLNQLKMVPGSAFEAVDSGPILH